MGRGVPRKSRGIKLDLTCVGNKRLSKREISRLLKDDNPTLLINIRGIRCSIDFDVGFEDEELFSSFTEMMNHFSGDIWLDKTYVCFKGNRFKDAFIREEGWRNLIRLCLDTDFGKSDRMAKNAISESLLTMVTFYLYGIAEKYGFDYSDIDIKFKENEDFSVGYFVDDRKEWNS